MAETGDAFEEAVLPALDGLYNLTRRLTRSGGAAEELAQETLTRAWAAWLHGTRPEKVGPWLATICLNLARDRARRTSRETPWPEDFDLPGRTDVEAEAIDRVNRELLDRALSGLPYEQRLAITLMDLCGLTAAETAQVTGSPRGTVLARVHRGRKAMARALTGLSPREDEEPGDRGRDGELTEPAQPRAAKRRKGSTT